MSATTYTIPSWIIDETTIRLDPDKVEAKERGLFQDALDILEAPNPVPSIVDEPDYSVISPAYTSSELRDIHREFQRARGMDPRR